MANEFPADWKAYKLDELGFVGRGKSKHRPRNDPILYEGIYPFIQTGDVKAANFYLKDFSQTYNEIGLKQSKLWEKGTLCITIAANIAETAILDIEACFPDSIIGFVPDKSKTISAYIKYYIDYIKLQMQQISQGTTQDNLSAEKLLSFNFIVPDITEQQKIVSILTSYDDLIENNNRRIAILEEMARSLYREWFVKFRFPGHEEVKMVDSELGQMPEGWSILKVDQLVDFHIGGGWGQEKLDEKHSQPAYVIRGTDINHVTHGNSSVIPYRFHSVSNLKSRKLEIGDIVFEVSGGSKGQPVGRALLISRKLLNNLHEDVMCASFCKLIRCNDVVPAEYFYLHLKEIYDNGQIDKYQVQSTGITNFKFQVFLEQEKVLIPPEAILEKFLQPIQSFFDQINVLGFKNLNLKTQRDMLLPKLISGKIPVI